jgi:hypothetical protein
MSVSIVFIQNQSNKIEAICLIPGQPAKSVYKHVYKQRVVFNFSQMRTVSFTSGWDTISSVDRVVFHQDGAIPHNAQMNFVFLNHLNCVGERWMGAYGAIRWPARSPDLNPLDFFIFIGYFRDNVYLTPPGTQKELKKG